MKIVILANFGMGLYNFRKELIEKLVKEGNQVYISLPYDEYVPRLVELGCEYIETSLDRRSTNPVKDFQLLLQYIKILKKYKPDAVLTYTIKPNIYGGIACNLMKTKYISNITGLGSAIENEGLLRKITLNLYKIGLKRSSCVFFQNQDNEELFTKEKIIKNKSRILPGSGVNLAQHSFQPYPNSHNTINILFVGRVMKEKGIDELIEAATEIKKSHPNVNFSIVGACEEDYLGALTELTQKNVVNYHGQQMDIKPFLRNAHAIVLPSYHEGLANVLLEAASTGRPILASKITGCKETFDENITGFGFEAKDATTLKEVICNFIEISYEEKRNMGIKSRVKMEKEFDRNIVIEAYLEELKIAN